MNLLFIVLGAGQGSRMGIPKWRCPTPRGTFLECVLGTLHEADVLARVAHPTPVCVVLPAEAGDAPPPLPRHVGSVINPDPESDMLASLLLAVRSHTAVDGYLVFPVDHPAVEPETVRALCDSFAWATDAVHIPVHNSMTGHPIIVPAGLFRQNPGGCRTLRDWIRHAGLTKLHIPVGDPGILRNMNRPEELQQMGVPHDQT